MGYPTAANQRLNKMLALAGSKSGAPGSAAFSKKISLQGRFTVDGANAPSGFVGDPHAAIRLSTGLFQLNLGGATQIAGAFGVKQYAYLDCNYIKQNAGSTLKAEFGGVINLPLGQFQIRIVDNTGSVQDPTALSANPNLNVVTWQIVVDNGYP